MSHDHQYIRDLVRLREEPRVPIIWLLLPWAAGLWWSVSVARALLAAPPAPVVGAPELMRRVEVAGCPGGVPGSGA